MLSSLQTCCCCVPPTYEVYPLVIKHRIWEISKLNGALYTVSGKITELLLEVSASHVADDTGGVNLEKLHPHVFFVCTVQMYAHVCYSICIICDHTYTLL